MTFRLLAALLLAVAIPLQGVAAVAAGQCMSLEHHQDAGHGHDHHDADATAHDHDGKKSSHCGPCVACCASASIAGAAALPIPAFSSETQYFYSQSPPPSVQPDGVYRPPLAL